MLLYNVCVIVLGDIAEHLLNLTAVHPLTGRPLPMFIVPSRHYGEYNDVDLGNVALLC